MKKRLKHLLSVIIPCYKQAGTITKDLAQIDQALTRLHYNYEIICVVDGRSDNTYSQAKKMESPKIKVVDYKLNKGKGYAVRFGMVRAKGDLIAFLDAGMDINPLGLSMLLTHMEWYKSDVIVGSIRHSASIVTDYPLNRKVLSWGYHSLAKILFGLRVTDSQRGIKIFKRKVLEKVLPRLLVKEYAFDIEMLAVAHRLGFTKIHDGPVEMDAKKLRYTNVKFFTIFSMLWETLAVFYRLRILKYYDDHNKRRWIYDPDLNFKINLG